MGRKKWKDVRATASPESIARAERKTEALLPLAPPEVPRPISEPAQSDRGYPLCGTAIDYINPTAPVTEEDWEALQPPRSTLPLAVDSLDLDITRDEIVAFVREGRERNAQQ